MHSSKTKNTFYILTMADMLTILDMIKILDAATRADVTTCPPDLRGGGVRGGTSITDDHRMPTYAQHFPVSQSAMSAPASLASSL